MGGNSRRTGARGRSLEEIRGSAGGSPPGGDTISGGNGVCHNVPNVEHCYLTSRLIKRVVKREACPP
jgi:hypothetical protein